MSQARLLPFEPRTTTALALSLLLAACGGGSDRMVSDGPDPSSNAQSIPQSITTSGVSNGTTAPATTANSGNDGAQPSGNAIQTVSTDTSATTETSPFSALGIRGSVLSTMLDQRVITGPHGPGASAAAFAAPATGTHGALIADPAAPNLLIGSGLNIDNYRYPSPNWQGLTNYDPGVYQPAVGDFVRFDSQDVLNLRGMVQTGTLPFTPVTTQIEISASSTAMSLDDEITARVGTGADTLTLELDAAAKRIIANQTMLHYGEIIQQWRNDDHVVQLILRKDGNNPATPALCWNYRLPGVGRLSCHVWEVPTDWQVGAPLNYKGHYVDDDRSHHAGESGHLYWRFAR